jgi:phage tail tape-measure protein
MVRKIPDGKAGGAGSTRSSRTDTESIFGDKRSGRDRREQQTSVTESRRQVSDRRKAGRGAQAAWWLERDYVESHHFVQKSSSAKTRKRDDTPNGK